MGDNSAYSYMEANVIAAYDAGLRGEQLAPFLELYRGTDIDSGGRCDLKTKDGLDIDAVLLSQFAPEKYVDLMAREPTDENAINFDELYGSWVDEHYDAVNAVTKRFGW